MAPRNIILLCLQLAVYVTIIVVAATRRHLRGKPWMIAFLLISFAMTLLWEFLPLLAGYGLLPFDLQRFYEIYAQPLNIVALANVFLLLPFLLAAGSEPHSEPARRGSGVEGDERRNPRSDVARPVTLGRLLFSFDDRIGRGTFWGIWFTMFLLNSVIGALLQSLISLSPMWGLAGLLWLPFAIWIALAMQAKRWHDRGKSAWMILIVLVPVLGLVWSLIELGFLRGTKGVNAYGVDPLGTDGGREEPLPVA